MKNAYVRNASRLLVPVLMLLVAVSRPAFADTLYTYTGTDFVFQNGIYPLDSDGNNYVIISFTLPSPAICLSMCPVTPITFNISTTEGGIGTAFGYVLLDTNASGTVVGWGIEGCDNPAPGCENFILSSDGFDEALIGNGFAFNAGVPGTWVVTTVPEPATVATFASGLVGVVCAFVRRRSLRIANRA